MTLATNDSGRSALNSVAFGWSVGSAVDLGVVACPEGMTPKLLPEVDCQIVVAGRPVTAVASTRLLYDPQAPRLERG